jgi:hexosaminidase
LNVIERRYTVFQTALQARMLALQSLRFEFFYKIVLMKNLILAMFICCFFSVTVFAQMAEFNIIPQPKSVNFSNGNFILDYKTKIVADDETGRKSAGILNDLLMKNYGFKLEYTDKPQKKNAITFMRQTPPDGKPEREIYALFIKSGGIQIGGSETGQFYAIQTLMQVLPVNFKGEAKIPAVEIIDEPRFSYRGMHLDVSRHFFPVSFVKKYLDLMSQYKFNQFHWHLTDDQGWRIEIKKYPKLTEIGSKRSETMKEKNFTPYVGDGVPVSGFYTQDEIREVVAYAKARRINIIPEIELPGHSSAALTAYPQLGCKENYQYKVQTTWGIFKEVFCPTETTFKFLEDVLSETIALFSDSPYIHIGGDEVLKDFWKESAEVKDLMKRENLKDEHEVQSYFIRRMQKFINSKGKKIIGWDEILDGGLAPNATVMSWRGEKGSIAAAKAKHDVIMTPSNFLYFDYGQGDPQYEPINIGNYVTLETVYGYDPHSKELNEDERKYILGAQGNVWTEYLKTPQAVEYMVFPRMLALAEVNWSPLETKSYADFLRRMNRQYQLLDKQNVNYRIPAPEGLQNVILSNTDKVKIDLKPAIANGKIFYTTDGTEPNENSKLYDKPFEMNLKPNETAQIKTIVVNEKGRKSVVYAATLLHRQYLEAIKTIDRYNFINFSYFKNSFKSVAEMDAAKPTEKGTTQSIQLPQIAKKQDLKEPFGVIFDGLISVPTDGIYEFQLESDDGAVLIIGDETVVDNDGLHSFSTKNGIVPLRKGMHRIRLKYIQGGGDAALNLRWGIKGTGLRRIYGNELFH